MASKSTVFCRPRVSLQTFEARQDNAVLDHTLTLRGIIDLHPGPDAQKIEHGQSSRVSSSAPGGEGVIGTGPVITQDFCRVLSEEESPVILARLAHRFRIAALYFQVFGRNVVGNADTLVQAVAVHGKALRQRLPRRGAIGFGQRFNLHGHLLINGVNRVGVGAE